MAEACLAVMPPLPAKASLSVENVRVCKLLGGSAADSHVVRGMVVQRNAEVCVYVSYSHVYVFVLLFVCVFVASLFSALWAVDYFITGRSLLSVGEDP